MHIIGLCGHNLIKTRRNKVYTMGLNDNLMEQEKRKFIWWGYLVTKNMKEHAICSLNSHKTILIL